MDKKRLYELADKYYRKAAQQEQNYQETGLTRYDTARRNAEDLADAITMAANAADEHGTLVSLRYSMTRLANMARDADDDPEALKKLKRELLAEARLYGLVT